MVYVGVGPRGQLLSLLGLSLSHASAARLHPLFHLRFLLGLQGRILLFIFGSPSTIGLFKTQLTAETAESSCGFCPRPQLSVGNSQFDTGRMFTLKVLPIY